MSFKKSNKEILRLLVMAVIIFAIGFTIIMGMSSNIDSLNVIVLLIWMTISIPFIVGIYSIIRAQRREGKWWKGLLRAIMFLIIVFISWNVFVKISSKWQDNERQKNAEASTEFIIMRAAVYENDPSMCDNLKTKWKNVCKISFEKSHDLCKKTFHEPKQWYYCSYNIMWLTDDVKECLAANAGNDCTNQYDMKKIMQALFNVDDTYCDKILWDKRMQTCKEDVKILKNTPPSQFIDALEKMDEERPMLYESMDIYKLLKQ